jgi:hypothetical protein
MSGGAAIRGKPRDRLPDVSETEQPDPNRSDGAAAIGLSRPEAQRPGSYLLC